MYWVHIIRHTYQFVQMPDSPAPIDRLSGLMAQCRVRAQLSYAGVMCGLSHFEASEGHAYLHVLRRGVLKVTHPAGRGVPKSLLLKEPSLLLYPRPLTHHFHNPPQDGSDFTCAQLQFDGGANNPLARALPPLVVLPLSAVDGLDASLTLLFAETDRVRCGQRLIADRLFEVVLLQLLRWLLDHPGQAGIQPGLITGLSDARLARALVAVHDQPGAAWTLARMAQCAGMSRTTFAHVFRELVGQTPMDYVIDWRILLAQARLREGQPVKVLAERLGYANPSALSRAFAARTGMSPRDWLKSVSAPGASTPP